MSPIEIMISMIVISLVVTAAAVGSSIMIERSKYTNCQQAMGQYSLIIEQSLMDHPKLQQECGQKLISDGSYSAVDETISLAYMEMLNKELEESMRLDTDKVVLTNQVDPWGNPYEFYVTTKDLDVNSDTVSSDYGKVSLGSNEDTEIRIIIKSNGPNGTITNVTKSMSAVGVAVDSDDILTIMQMNNGTVKSGSHGFKTNKASVRWLDETAKVIEDVYVL